MANRTRLFCDAGEFDLSSDSPITLTFQINDLGNPANQQGNTSNQFQLPDTQNNRTLLGFPNNVNFYDPAQSIQISYTQIKVRLQQNDIEILPNAVMELGDPAYDTNQFNVTILSGNIDFFDQIGGQLADMGDSTSQWSNYGANLVWKPYDHVWNLRNAANSQKNTESTGNNGIGGWIYPIVDYGLFTDDFTQRIDVHFMRPGFFIKTAIDLLLKFTGYKGRGSLLKNPLYPLLIAQFSNSSWDHGIDYQNQPDTRGLKAAQSRNITLNHPNNLNPGKGLTFDTVISDPSHQFTGNQYFTLNAPQDYKISVTIPHLYMQGWVSPSSNTTTLDIAIIYVDPSTPSMPTTISNYFFGFGGYGEKNPTNPNAPGSDPKGWTRLNSSGGHTPPLSNGGNIYAEIDIYNAVISTDQSFPVGAIIYVAYAWHNRNPAFATIYPCSLNIVSQNQSVQFGQDVQCERIFPDVSQKDLIKDTLQRFGIICQTDDYSKTITFASLGDIVNNITLAKDWSSKLLNQGRQVSLIFPNSSFSQVNYLEYQVDPNGGLTEIPLKKWWSQINVRNQTLSPIANDLLVSIFGGSLNRNYIGDSIANIQMVDPTDDQKAFSISVAPRILIDQKLDLIALGKSVTFTDDPTSDPADPAHNITINDVISVPYFSKPNMPDNMDLDWAKLKLLYYPVLEKILKNCKVQTEYFILTPLDILQLDLLMPIYLEQYSGYYYINNIASWIENVPVKITLVRIG